MNDNNNKKPRQVRHTNVLESLKDIGGSTTKSFKEDLIKEGSKDFMNQLFGTKPASWGKSYSGEIAQGENLEIDQVLSGERESNQKLEHQLAMERRLREEEKALLESKGNELKLQLHALMQELAALAKATPKLAREIEIATIQAPTNPGIYHVIFFQKLLEFIKSFREKVEDASIWLHTANKRAEKKNFWNSYKKMGGKRLLSSEDYSQRSAG